jgi:hypothetical protein
MPHLPYSSDLAHSDFCLFPTIKENWNGFKWLTRTSFWMPATDFEGSGWIRIE